jgi:hypothetical protein
VTDSISPASERDVGPGKYLVVGFVPSGSIGSYFREAFGGGSNGNNPDIGPLDGGFPAFR